MQKRHLVSLVALGLAATSAAAPFRLHWMKTQPFLMSPNENILLRSKDLGGGMYGVYGNLSNGTQVQPMFGRFNRYGVQQAADVLPGFLGDKSTHFMDYTDDTCMTFQTTLPNGRPGIGVARINQAGNTVYRTVREINTVNGHETITDAVVDPSGAIYVLGEAQSTAAASSAFLAKFNSNGTAAWVRTWFKNEALDLAALPDGTVVVSKLGNFEIQGLRVMPNGASSWTVVLSDGQVDGVVNPPAVESISFNYQDVNMAGSYRDLTSGVDRLVVRRINVITGAEEWENLVEQPSEETSIKFQDIHLSAVGMLTDILVSSIQQNEASGARTANFRKLSGAGSLAWQRNLTVTGRPEDNQKVSVTLTDPYGEIYWLIGNIAGSSRLVKYAPNGTQRWLMALLTPGEMSIQCGTMLGFTDIMISSYSFGAMDTGAFMMAGIQQSAVALNDNYNVKMNAPSTPSTPVIANDRYAAGATISVTTPPQNGTVLMYSNGVFRYTPNNGFMGQDTFNYTLSKPGLTPSAALVRLNVQAP